MEQFITKLLSDFGITGGLYIVIILAFLYYIPKLINQHFKSIELLTDKFEKNLNRVVESFDKQIDNSNNWHIEHNKQLVEIKTDIKDIKFKIYNIKDEKN